MSDRIAEVRKVLANRTSPPQFAGRSAGIAVILTRDFESLLIRRVDRTSDPWSGQWAFPGGMAKEVDRDLFETVRRETLEEVGIDISGMEVLGWLEPKRPSNRPELVVAPLVLLTEERINYELGSEVAEARWVPLTKLVRAKAKVMTSAGEREVDAYFYRDVKVWGLSARILDELFAALSS